MDTIISKAAKGNRTALTELYEANKQEIYYLCLSLLNGNSISALSAAKSAFKSSFQAVSRGELPTEEIFTAYAVKQAAANCKKAILSKDGHAFKLPPQKNFNITQVNERYLEPSASPIDNYIHCLPTLQRFSLILQSVGKMSVNQTAAALGLDSNGAELLKAAESENLGKIYRVMQAKNLPSIAPTPELLASAFEQAIVQIAVPAELESYVSEYIDTVATPYEAEAKKKWLTLGGLLAAFVLAAVILFSVFGQGTNEVETPDEELSATPVVSVEVSDTENDTEISTEPDSSDDMDENSDIDSDAVTSEPETVESPSPTEEVGEPIETPAPEESGTSGSSVSYCYADIEIEGYGIVTVALDAENAPITTENFITLAESGFYDGLTFHRIIDGFMMQGGDPNGNGTGGSDQTIVGEFSDNGYDNPLSHTRGAISMARSSDYNSASSQFFIVHEDSTFLDGQYAVFGYVTEGMDIVDAICTSASPTDSNGTIPADEQPVITSVVIRNVVE